MVKRKKNFFDMDGYHMELSSDGFSYEPVKTHEPTERRLANLNYRLSMEQLRIYRTGYKFFEVRDLLDDDVVATFDSLLELEQWANDLIKRYNSKEISMSKFGSQPELIFFGDDHPEQLPEPTHEEKLKMIDRNNPESPFSKFIGNDKAVSKLQTAAYHALGNPNHVMRELAFAIFGPSSVGKTSLVRIYAETVGLPFLEISPKSVKTLDNIHSMIIDVLQEHNLPLVETEDEISELPPMVIFIDEVHALSDSIVQGLLKATEFNDAQLVTETLKVIDTYNVTWMIATTDEGKLFDAFRTRFNPIMLNYLNKKEMAQVIKKANPDFSDEACDLVALYNTKITRKALEFARYMRLRKEMFPDMTMEQIAHVVAREDGIDEFGMSEVHLKILTALGEGPIARNRIILVTGRKEEETERFIMPWLLSATDDEPALVTVTQKGYTITPAGLHELDKRKIPNNGTGAMAA